MIAAVVGGFVAGLASLFHCAGMCGPLCAAACNGLPRQRALGTYLGARIASYSLMGGLAGGMGGAIARRAGESVSAILLTSTIALGLLFLAVRVWPRSEAARPGLVQLGTKPRPTAPRWAPLAMGAVTGLLPCGALFSALVVAAGTGAALDGAALMLAFGLASSPALFAMGRAAAYLERVGGRTGRRVIAGVLVVGAIVTAVRPLAMREGHGCHDVSAPHALAAARGEEGTL